MNPELPAAEHGIEDTDAPTVVRIIRESRACAGCGYDLRGQRVVLDPLYSWMIVRCPECGRVEPLQAGRTAVAPTPPPDALQALVWLVFVLCVACGFGAGLFGVAQSAMVVWIAGPDWYSNPESSPLDALAETLWSVPVSVGGWFVLFGLMPQLTRGQRWFVLAIVVLAMAVGWWVYLATYFAPADFYELRHIYGHATVPIIESVGLMGILTSAIVVVQAAATMVLLRPFGRWVVKQLAPEWVMIALQGLWKADGLEVPVEAQTTVNSRRQVVHTEGELPCGPR